MEISVEGKGVSKERLEGLETKRVIRIKGKEDRKRILPKSFRGLRAREVGELE